MRTKPITTPIPNETVMNPIRVYFTGDEEFLHLYRVFRAAHYNQDLSPDEKASVIFVNQKLAKAYKEYNEEVDENLGLQPRHLTGEGELRELGRLTAKVAKKALEDIEAGRSAQARIEQAKDRGDIQKRGHFK
jgi:hypothetical protein